MSGKSDYLENKVLDHVLGGPDYTRPATVYLALFTTAPTDAGGGVEVAGGNYMRETVSNDGSNFPAASGGAKALNGQHAFTLAAADWGTVVAVGIFDDPAAGNMLYWGLLDSPEFVPSGRIAKFDSGSLTFIEE